GQLAKFLSFEGENAAIMANNHDWLSQLNIIEFLRDYGKHFNVSYMINKDVVASRLEKGISFTEFTYTILQAADWLHLYDTYNCELQIGGSDQWGNLTSGMDLIRKVRGDKAKVFGITSPLITKSDGSKFGKSEGKNVWLDPEKTSAYEFYQFWVNVADTDIVDYLKRLSFHTKEEIEELALSVENEPHLRKAQKALADELTEMVHGAEGLETAHKITDVLFGGDIRELNVDQIKMALQDAVKTEVANGIELLDAMTTSGVCSSRREARELLKNGVLVNGERVKDEHFVLNREMAFDHEFVTIRKGKKSYFVLNLTD
ncbi:MAG: tyrosine--tRNA ligase, partial [Erysipelotrichaceae bacterium]|nr:tyrosine--tRNA ligase [Erysipelotrichaceae bacterium]